MSNKPEMWVFATSNPNKVAEVQQMAGEKLEFRSLSDMGYYNDLPEDFDTLAKNAIQKAEHAYSLFNFPCFAEDSGLEVDSLNGAPGAFSARYAGIHGDHAANIEKLLREMSQTEDRSAQFRTVFALVDKSAKLYTFEGICRGRIARQASGSAGFGYDPVFIPDGYDISFAEMDAAEKNRLSHRGKALKLVMEFLGL